ncbi:MAG TPA: LapA family protein [Solirubrobacterales bacterium]
MNEALHTGGRQEGGTNWKLWLAGIAALLLAIFVVQNAQKVVIDFLFVETETPLIFGLLVAGLLGFAIGWLAPIVRRGRREDRP